LLQPKVIFFRPAVGAGFMPARISKNAPVVREGINPSPTKNRRIGANLYRRSGRG